MAIHHGYTVDSTIFEKLISKHAGKDRRLAPPVYDMPMNGSRMLIIRDLAPEEYRMDEDGPPIMIPDTAAKDPPGIGFVVSVGDMVGQGQAPHPHGIQCETPADMLYQRVVFGMWSGKEFRVNFLQRGYECNFWVLTDRDVWMVDNSFLAQAETIASGG